MIIKRRFSSDVRSNDKDHTHDHHHGSDWLATFMSLPPKDIEAIANEARNGRLEELKSHLSAYGEELEQMHEAPTRTR